MTNCAWSHDCEYYSNEVATCTTRWGILPGYDTEVHPHPEAHCSLWRYDDTLTEKELLELRNSGLKD